jgi:hypothetical protein
MWRSSLSGSTVSIGAMSAWRCLARLERGGEGGPVALVDDRVEPDAPVDRVAVDDAGKQRQERRVGAQDAALRRRRRSPSASN